MPIPPFAADMILCLDDRSVVWSDTAMTTVQTTSGGRISAIQDVSGNNFNCTLVTGRTPAQLNSVSYTQKAIAMAGSAMTFGQPAALITALNDASQYSVFNFAVSPASDCFILYKGTEGPQRIGIGWIQSSGGWGNFQQCDANSVDPGSSQPHSWAYSIYPTETPQCQRVFVAGAAVNSVFTATLPAADTTNDLRFGGWGEDASYDYTGTVLALCVFERTLLPHEVMQLSDYYYARFGVANPRLASPYHIVWESNSLSTDFVRKVGLSGNYATIPERVRLALGLPYGSLHNLSVPGKQTGEITADAPTIVDPFLALLPSNPIYVMWEGSNDVSAADIQTECLARIAAGWSKTRIVVGTCLPRTASGFDAARDAENGIVRLNFIAYSGQLADVASDRAIGQDGDASNSTYYQDGVHLTDAGAAIAAPYFEAASASAASATGFAFAGPTQGAIGAASDYFVLTPTGGLFSGTVTLGDGGAGGTFTPAKLEWSNSKDAKTFTYTPNSAGAKTIAPLGEPAIEFAPNALTYTAVITSWIEFIGDSWTVGAGSTLTTYPQLVRSILGSNWSGENRASSLWHVSDLSSDLANWVTANFNAVRPVNIAYVLIGLNDLGNGTSAAGLYANLQAYCQAIKGAQSGWQIIVFTLPSCNDLGNQLDATIIAFNTLLRANYSFADVLADLASDPHMSPSATSPFNSQSSIWYSNSGLHAADPGYTAIAAWCLGAIARLLLAEISPPPPVALSNIRIWVANPDGTVRNSLSKAAGDSLFLTMDFGDIPDLIDGKQIVSCTISPDLRPHHRASLRHGRLPRLRLVRRRLIGHELRCELHCHALR